MIKKTYIPGKPRNPKLGTATGTSGVGKTEFNQVAGSSHEHYNKGVLDQITEAMLVGALRDLITSTDTESELTDENILSSLRVLGEITKNNETFLEDLKEQFLSKINPDTAQKLITFIEGVEVGTFTTGALGSGAAVKMVDGTSYAEVDNLTVRQKATFRELIIESLKHIGGQLVLTPARMKCVRVVDGGTYYKCYFDTGDGEVSNEFVEGDLARCQVFTGNGTKFYWRLVTLVGEDWINLSKTSAAEGSDAPEAGDDIAQLGNATDTTRQSAIILSTVGIDAPSWKQYSGINSFSLEGKETTVFSKLGNRISGETVFTSGGANLEDYLDGVAQDILDALTAAQDAEDKAQQAIEDAEADVATINEEMGRLQDQIDGKVSNWFYAYTPTLSNHPASDWTTNEIKDSHIGDTFTNIELAPAENAGKSWRFVKNGSTYSWTVISDSDALKALLEASKAQATADGKSTTHLFQPTKYKLGDMWVLNDDYTVNGTLYKQGELLTATQDSETFVQSHWLKRVRYTDDTAIDNLEIGGRNLLLNSDFSRGFNYYWSLLNSSPESNFEIVGTSLKATFVEGSKTDFGKFNFIQMHDFSLTDNVIISAMIKGEGDLKIRFGTTQNPVIHINNEIFKKFTQIIPKSSFGNGSLIFEVSSGELLFDRLKLEKGTKATDWTPAPEDVEANIETAKTEAENAAKAYADIQAEAERVLAEAYADDIVTAEEQARIDDVNNKLATAKEYADAQDALLKIQQEAYADDKITTAEQAAIQAAKDYADLKKTEAEAYADGIVSDEEARAIADALEKYNESKAYAETLVDNIEIGGRNLILNTSSDWRQVTFSGWQLYVPDYVEVDEGDTLVVKVEYSNPIGGGVTLRGHYYDESKTKIGETTGTSLLSSENIDVGEEGFLAFRYSIPSGVSFFGVSLRGTDNTGRTVSYRYLKLERGNKATDWTPAPEDVQAEIDGLGGYMEGAFQDSVIDKAEAKAIGEHLKTINDRYVTDNAVYNNLIANPFLIAGTVRTTLQNVMQNIYRRDKPLLDTAINNIVNNKTVTTPLRTAFNTAFANYRLAITSFQTAVEDARKAIEEQRVDDIEIGGRNLAFGEVLRGYDIGGGLTPNNAYRTFKTVEMQPGRYIISHKTEMGVRIEPSSNIVILQGSGTFNFTNPLQIEVTEASEFYITLRKSDTSDLGDEYVSMESLGFKLEKGTKATDWTPAPEDTESEILEAQGYMKARYIRDWINGSSVNVYNHWVQITALNKAGTNIALNKTVTSNITTPNLGAVTNGNMDVTNFAVNSSGGNQYVQIDLGQLYYDIDNINVYHNWAGNRVYNDTKTEISEDGVNWKTIFDSEVSGTYVETEGGKVHTQRYASVMARIAETEAKTRFQTLIDGGLIYTALMKLFDTISGDETAFISGKQGSGKNLPAFGAGGSYQDAIAGTAKAIIRHDGSSKFEEAQVSGSIIAKGSSGMRTELDETGIRVFNDGEQMNIRFGMKNGYAVLEYYDNDENLLYDLGPSGITEIEIREEKWTAFKRIYLGGNITTILNSSNRDKYKKSWQQTETTYYAYTSKIVAGVNHDPTNDGVIFTSMNKAGAKMPLGFYCRKMPLNKNMRYKDATGTNQIINSQLPYIQSGNENVYDRNNICYMPIEHYINGKRSTSFYSAYWNETPEGYPEDPEI